MKRVPFPQQSLNPVVIWWRLIKVWNELRRRKIKSAIGYPYALPHRLAVSVWRRFLPFNPNHLGKWSNNKKFESASKRLERELIMMLADLYRVSISDVSGYVTSGATEGNIFSAWIGRNYLQKKGIKNDNICLLKTSLSHYSIAKAADVVGINQAVVGVNEKWSMDESELKKKVESLYKKGTRGLIIPFTLGYTLSGTDDNYLKLIDELRQCKKKYSKLEFYCWIDAAVSGLVKPFIDNAFAPFTFPEINTLVVDFHKFGGVPYPAGIILFRNKHSKLIERSIDYLPENDSTLLGSRTGIAPLACWAIIKSLGKPGFNKWIQRCFDSRDEFISNYKRKSGVKLIVNPQSLNLGIVVNNNKIKKELEEKYNLYFRKVKISFAKKTREYLMSKVFFLIKSN